MGKRKRPLCMLCGKRPVRMLTPETNRVVGKPGYTYRMTYGYNPDEPDAFNGPLDYFCSAACASRYARASFEEVDFVTVWCNTHEQWERLNREGYGTGARCINDD